MSELHPGLADALAAMEPGDFMARTQALAADEYADALRHRFRHDVAGFLRYFFPAPYAERTFTPYHRAVLSRRKVPWRERRNTGRKTLRAVAAPRSTAKTAINIGDVVHDIIYGIEAVIPILSAELSLSRTSLRTIREMVTSPEIEAVYGAVKVQGGTDRYTVTTSDGASCTLIAKSFGTSVRGLKDGQVRPTRLIVDDGEDKLRVHNPDQRGKWWSFLTEDILKLGDIGGGLIVDWLGTVLHEDSVLARLLRAPGWQSERYAALLEWPERQDLWQECGRIWADLDRGDLDQRRADALAFYEAHRDDMDRGARMLAEEWVSLFAFYEAIWTEGLSSVLKELQNRPRDPADCLFDLDLVRRFRWLDDWTIQNSRGQRVDLRRCAISIWLDPSKGEPGSDFAALAVVARETAGWTYVLSVKLLRRQPTQQHLALWAAWERWRYARSVAVGYDATGTQGLLEQALDRDRDARRRAGQAFELPAKGRTLTEGKGKIKALEPYLHNGWTEIADDLDPQCIEQLRDWPTHAHDDGPDAIFEALNQLINDTPTAGWGTLPGRG